MWGWVPIIIVLGKKIYDAITEDDSSSPSPPPRRVPSPSRGPSREKLKRRQKNKICRDAADTATQFIQAHSDYLQMENSEAEPRVNCRSLETLKNAYAPFLKSYSAIKGRSPDQDSAACLTESLNEFKRADDDGFIITPGAKLCEASERHDFLEKARARLEEPPGPKVPRTLQKYANDYARTDEARKLVSLWRGLNKNAAEAEAPRVVVCGRVKMGKSSLLNMLIGDFSDDPYFGIDVVPKTCEEKTRERDGLIYVDTPGLDAELEDEEKAWQSFLKADCFIFVHSLKGGELVQQELDFLGRLREERRPTAENMLVVLTYAEVCDEEKLNRLQGTIGDQLERKLGRRPWMTAVSNTRYKKGLRENEPRLAKTSGLPALQSHIKAQRDLLAAGASPNRAAEINELREKIGALLKADLAAAKRRCQKLTDSDKEAYAAMLREYETICTNWKKAVKAYEEAR